MAVETQYHHIPPIVLFGPYGQEPTSERKCLVFNSRSTSKGHSSFNLSGMCRLRSVSSKNQSSETPDTRFSNNLVSQVNCNTNIFLSCHFTRGRFGAFPNWTRHTFVFGCGVSILDIAPIFAAIFLVTTQAVPV